MAQTSPVKAILKVFNLSSKVLSQIGRIVKVLERPAGPFPKKEKFSKFVNPISPKSFLSKKSFISIPSKVMLVTASGFTYKYIYKSYVSWYPVVDISILTV